MNQDEIVASVDLIKASLFNRDSETITGAMLGELIRKVTPELDLKLLYPAGQRVLTRFIRDYCTGFLSPLQRQGGDVLYSITAEPSEEVSPTSSSHSMLPKEDYEFWVTFARPNASSNILVSPDIPAIAIGSSKALSSGWIVVKSVTPGEMVVTRQSFVESLTPGMYAATVYSHSGSYSDWLQSVRQCGGTLFNQWSMFRIERLHGLFRERLLQLGICGDKLELLCETMKRSQEGQPKKHPSTKDSATSQSAKPSVLAHRSSRPADENGTFLRSEEAFRGAVIEAVKQMSLAEMRALNIPAGLFMDSVNIIFNK